METFGIMFLCVLLLFFGAMIGGSISSETRKNTVCHDLTYEGKTDSRWFADNCKEKK